jgi:hypothetical protein
MAEGTHGSFGDILGAAGPRLRPLCGALRDLIASLDGDVHEVVWPRQKIASYGLGPRKMTEHYAYVAVQKAHVNLGFYHGTRLRDPTGLLEGTGKSLRHVKIRSASDAGSRAVAALVRAAIAERRSGVRRA